MSGAQQTARTSRRGPAGLVSRLGGPVSWKAMLWLWLVYAMNANMRAWIQTVQPAIVREFNVSPTTIGIFSGVLTILLGVAAIPLSLWSDKGGHGWERKFRHLPMVAAMLLFSLLTGVHALTTTFAAIFIFQAVKNLASGAAEPVAVTSIAEWWPLERRGFAQGLHHTAFPWGTLLGGLGASAVLSTFGPERWRYIFLILPLLVIPIFIGYWRFAQHDTYKQFVQDTDNRHLTPPLGSVDGAEELKAEPGAVRRALANPNVLLCGISTGLANVGFMGLTFWLPLYLSFVANYPLALVAIYSVLFAITGGIGQILWGWVSDTFGRKYTLVLLFTWLAISFTLYQFVGKSLAILVIVQLVTGLAINGVYPVMYALTSDSSERGAIAVGNGINLAGMLIGGFGAIVMGLLISLGGGYSSPTGFLYGLYFIAGVSLLTAILLLLFTRESTGWMYSRDRALVSRERCLRSGR